MADILCQITCSHFRADLVVDQEGIIVKAAPICAWMVRTDLATIQAYCKRKGWKLEFVN